MAPTGKVKAATAREEYHHLYNYRWQQEREEYLRQHPLCVMCQAEGKVTVATIVDHKQPHHGDPRLFWDPSNRQGLCKPHHDSEKQRQERASGHR